MIIYDDHIGGGSNLFVVVGNRNFGLKCVFCFVFVCGGGGGGTDDFLGYV